MAGFGGGGFGGGGAGRGSTPSTPAQPTTGSAGYSFTSPMPPQGPDQDILAKQEAQRQRQQLAEQERQKQLAEQQKAAEIERQRAEAQAKADAAYREQLREAADNLQRQQAAAAYAQATAQIKDTYTARRVQEGIIVSGTKAFGQERIGATEARQILEPTKSPAMTNANAGSLTSATNPIGMQSGAGAFGLKGSEANVILPYQSRGSMQNQLGLSPMIRTLDYDINTGQPIHTLTSLQQPSGFLEGLQYKSQRAASAGVTSEIRTGSPTAGAFFGSLSSDILGNVIGVKNIVTNPIGTIAAIPGSIANIPNAGAEFGRILRESPTAASGTIAGELLTFYGPGKLVKGIGKTSEAFGYPKFNTIFMGKPVTEIQTFGDVNKQIAEGVAYTKKTTLFSEQGYITGFRSEVRTAPILGGEEFRSATIFNTKPTGTMLGSLKPYYGKSKMFGELSTGTIEKIPGTEASMVKSVGTTLSKGKQTGQFIGAGIVMPATEDINVIVSQTRPVRRTATGIEVSEAGKSTSVGFMKSKFDKPAVEIIHEGTPGTISKGSTGTAPTITQIQAKAGIETGLKAASESKAGTISKGVESGSRGGTIAGSFSQSRQELSTRASQVQIVKLGYTSQDKFSQSVIPMVKTKQDTGQTDATLNSISSFSAQESAQEQRTPSAIVSLSGQAQAQDTKERYGLTGFGIPATPSTSFNPAFNFKYPELRGITPQQTKRSEERRLGRGYKVQVKRRGKFITLPGTYSKEKGLDVGAKSVLGTLARTFRLTPSGTTTESSGGSVFFNRNSQKFRTFQQRNREQRNLPPLTFIQKNRYSLGSFGERREIRAARRRFRL